MLKLNEWFLSDNNLPGRSLSDKKDHPLNEEELSNVEDIITSTDESSEAEQNESSLNSDAPNEVPHHLEESEQKENKQPIEKSSSGAFSGIFFTIVRGLWRVSRILILIAVIIGSLLAAAYVLQQDDLVRSQFEGKRWALPARVFARPLEIYEGQSLQADDFHKELQLLNYTYVTHLVGTGQFKRDKNTFIVQTRGFKFAEDQEISRRIRIDIKKGKISNLENTESKEPLTLMRLEPVLIGNFYPRHNEDRVLVKLDDVPPLLTKGLIAVEDRNYYDHFGVNPKSIARAIVANAKAGRKVQGGSTLTQQLVKNFFLSNEQSYIRKANEAVMSMLLEVHYSKDEILEAYMNEIFLGQNKQRAIHGFGLASQFYFNKPIKELRPEQVALLIGVAKGATYYNPRKHPKRAVERRNIVIDVMAREGVLEQKLASELKTRPLGVTQVAPPSVSPFPSYLELVRKQLQRDYQEEDLRSEGLLIFTSMDPVVQIEAELALKNRINKLEKSRRMKKDKLNGAMVVSSVQGAEVLAVVGGRDARFAGYNRALSASRQIGSLIKPAVYLAALSEGYTLGTPIDGGPVTVRLSKTKVWEPKNYSGKDMGMVSFEKALVKSMNTPTVRIGITIGLEKVIKSLHDLGLQKEVQANPSLLLGALELTPMEVQQVYQTIAAGGTYTPLTAIRSVMNSYGKALKRYPLQVKQVASEDSIYLLSHAMNKITKEGTAQYLRSILPAWKNSAGKTGTTNKNVDSWFAGFTGKHVISVWVGRDDNKPTGFTGSSGALRVWGDLVKKISTQPFKPKKPKNVRFLKVDSESGLLFNPDCGKAIVTPFLKGTEPTETSPCAAPEVYYEVENNLENQQSPENAPVWQRQPSPQVNRRMNDTDRMNLNNNSVKAKPKPGAKIWNGNKQLNNDGLRRPAPVKDNGAWIDNLMER